MIDVGPLGPLGPDDLDRLGALHRQGAGHVWHAAEVEQLRGTDRRLTEHAAAAARDGGDYRTPIEARTRIRALLGQITAGTAICTAGQAEPVAWVTEPGWEPNVWVTEPGWEPNVAGVLTAVPPAALGPGSSWDTERARLAAGMGEPLVLGADWDVRPAAGIGHATAEDQARAQISGLATAVSNLQSHLEDGVMAAPRGERLAHPAELLGAWCDPSLRGALAGVAWRPSRRVVTGAAYVIAAVCVLAGLFAAAPPVAAGAAGALALFLAVRAARTRPGRTAELYDHGVMAAPVDHGAAYAAALARFVVTGADADKAEMEAHVTATPDDGGPRWAPPV